jgi:hypothetical protein
MNVTWWKSDAWLPCSMNEMLSAGVPQLKGDVLRRLTVRDVRARVFLGPSSIA